MGGVLFKEKAGQTAIHLAAGKGGKQVMEEAEGYWRQMVTETPYMDLLGRVPLIAYSLLHKPQMMLKRGFFYCYLFRFPVNSMYFACYE